MDILFWFFVLAVLMYYFARFPIKSTSDYLSGNGFFASLLLILGISWLFGDDDDHSDDC